MRNARCNFLSHSLRLTACNRKFVVGIPELVRTKYTWKIRIQYAFIAQYLPCRIVGSPCSILYSFSLVTGIAKTAVSFCHTQTKRGTTEPTLEK